MRKIVGVLFLVYIQQVIKKILLTFFMYLQIISRVFVWLMTFSIGALIMLKQKGIV